MIEPSVPAHYATELARSYARFRRLLDGLSAAERSAPILAEGWSPLALVAHVAFWDDFQLQRMEAALSGAWAESVPWPTEENDVRAVRDGRRQWDEVLADADRARDALVAFGRRVSAQEIDSIYREGGKERPVLKILLSHMSKHVNEHADTLYGYLSSLKRWGRDGFRTFYRQQYDNFVDGISGLSEESCLSIPVEGEWTVRDLLVHVLCWDEFCEQALQTWPEDGPHLERWRGDDFDLINRRLQSEYADAGMIQILDQLITVHRRILRHFDRMNDEELESVGRPAQRRETTAVGLLYRMSIHRAEHAVALWEARGSELRPERI